MSSFAKASQLGSKAEKMLGVGSHTVFSSQKEGWMYKRPFGKGGNRGSWQKRYFVLKDSFLLWYEKKPKALFDIHPSGCLPLGGCGVFPYGLKENEFLFEVTHADFHGSRLLLRTDNKVDADDWMQVLSECRIATWENAIVGDALLDKLKYAGSTVEKGKERALKEAQEAAAKAVAERQAKEETVQMTTMAKEAFRTEILQEQKRASGVKRELNMVAAKLSEETAHLEKEKQLREEYEKKLNSATAALSKLEKALASRHKNIPEIDRAAFQRSAAKLRDYFQGKEPEDEADATSAGGSSTRSLDDVWAGPSLDDDEI